MKDTLNFGCGYRDPNDSKCGQDGLCKSCLHVKEALELQKKEILEKLILCRDKTVVWVDERWDKFERMFKKELKQIISENVHSPNGQVTDNRNRMLKSSSDGSQKTAPADNSINEKIEKLIKIFPNSKELIYEIFEISEGAK
jgi:hypothetical protein